MQQSHCIRSVSIVGGFLDGIRLDLADGLNCLIGARGTGKTTVLEIIRWVTDALPGQADDQAERRRIESLIEKNLGEGRVQLEIDSREGLRYFISRMAGESPVVLTADQKPADGSLRSAGIFNADIFSQNQIENLADRPLAQLALIDNFAAERIAGIDTELRKVRARLAANAGQIIPLQQQDAILCEEIAILPNLEQKLKSLGGNGTSQPDVVNQAHVEKGLRHRERLTMDQVRQFLESYVTEVSALEGQLALQGRTVFAAELQKSPNRQALAEAREHLMACAQQVDQLVSRARTAIVDEIRYLERAGANLTLLHQQQDLAFHQLIEKHGKLQGQAAERARLERQRSELLAKQHARMDLADKLLRFQAERKALLHRLSDLRDERFAIRQGIAETINKLVSPAVHVRMVQFRNQAPYLRMLEEALKGCRIRHGRIAEKIASSMAPSDLVELVRKKHINRLVEVAELNCEQAHKVIMALSDQALLLELEAVEMFDQPEIELRDGEEYKKLTELSTGQKCTAILPILLLDSDKPLLVDQPEDNLDNRFIFEIVVERIRQVKSRRQLIFVTHNPNIPVLGDADRVFVLESNGLKARKANEGTVDECKQEVVTVLEGGAKAFEERMRRYQR